MKIDYSYRNNIVNSTLRLFTIQERFTSIEKNEFYSIIFNRGKNVSIRIDGITTTLKENDILTLTPTNTIEIEQKNDDLLIFQFNREFYCVEYHDREVSCIGFIFYGSTNFVSIKLDNTEQNKFKRLIEMFIEEFEIQDNIQGEMLTVLLKRLIIQCTRIAKQQLFGTVVENSKYDLIRQFNVLVEKNFRTQHDVSFYAKQLNKSPKTLSNVFASYKQSNPSTIIHGRILSESKRQLRMSSKSIKEIAYELNFQDIQSFSRFFRIKEGASPSDFRKSAN